MASNRIGYDDIFDPKALDKAIEEVKRLQEELKGASDELKEMVKTSSDLAKVTNNTFKNADNIREVEKAIEDVKKQTTDLDAIERKRKKLTEQLNELDDVRAKNNALLSERLKERRKALRDEAKETLAQKDAYAKLRIEANKAQLQFKKMAVEFGVNSKEAKSARKEFERLDDQLREVNDAAKDGRRDVGRYHLAIEKLGSTIKDISIAGGALALITKVMDGLSNVMGNNSEAAATLEKGMARITITFTVLLSRLTKALPLLSTAVQQTFAPMEEGFLRMQRTLLAAKGVFKGIFGDTTEEVAAINKRLDELSKVTSKATVSAEDIAKVFEGMGDEIEKTVAKNDVLIDTTLRYRREILALQKAVNAQLSLQAQLQAAADNENNSLIDRIDAQEQLLEQTAKIDTLELQIAAKREELAIKNAKIFKDSLDAQEAAAQATTERITLEITQEQERLAQKTELSTLEADLVEQRLDFLIDNFDNQKTINERIIGDEKTTFEERNRLLEENKRLADESYDAQLAAFNERLAEQGEAQLDFEQLVNESDSRLIAEQALNAGLSERLTNRLLEVIRERRTVNQDNVETQQDLNEATKESLVLEEETALNLETVNKLKEEGVDVEKVLASLEDERLSMQIDNLRMQIALLQKGSEARIDLEKQLSDALLEEQNRRLEKEAQAEEEAAQRRIEIQEAAATVIESFAQKTFEKRLDRIDTLIDAEKERESELRELAQKGIQDADNNLAESQKRAAELEKQREKELQRQKNFELGLAAAKAYSANVAADVPNPLAKTITDVTLLEAFIDSLVGFYHGTEDTGNSGLLADEYGVITGYTHANERVMTAQQNSLLPDSVSNWELVSLANLGAQAVNTPATADLMLANGLKEVKNAIERKPSYLGRDYDATEKAVIDTYHEKGRKLRKHYKRGGLISRKRA